MSKGKDEQASTGNVSSGSQKTMASVLVDQGVGDGSLVQTFPNRDEFGVVQKRI